METSKESKQRRGISTNTFVFATLAVISFSLLFFSNRSSVFTMKNAGLNIVFNIRGILYEGSSFVSRTVLSIRELAILRREYTELVNRITRYEQLERSAAEIGQENRRLREQLGYAETIRFRHIPAEIIGRDPDNLYSALVINKGALQGVAYNMPVIAFQNGVQALVGKVIQVSQFESLVMPLFDTNAIVPARLNTARYDGLVEGQGNRNAPLRMRYINKRAREEINYGDIIITSGIQGIVDAVYPGGINIGRVSAIYFQENETSMEVELEAFIDFSRLEYLFVIDASLNTSDYSGNQFQ